MYLTQRSLDRGSDHVGVVDTKEHIALEEEHWTLGCCAHALKLCLLIAVTLEIDMCHLEESTLHAWTYLCLVGC